MLISHIFPSDLYLCLQTLITSWSLVEHVGGLVGGSRVMVACVIDNLAAIVTAGVHCDVGHVSPHHRHSVKHLRQEKIILKKEG